MHWDSIILAIILFSIPIIISIRKAIREVLPEHLTILEIEHTLLHMLREGGAYEKPSLDACRIFLDALIRIHSDIHEKDVEYQDTKTEISDDEGDGNSQNGRDKGVQINDSNYLRAQEIARLCFLTFPNDDKISIAAMSLLIVVSKSAVVKDRVMTEADRYGLNTPIAIARFSLDRRKNSTETTFDHDQEQTAAELQRKSALLLGSFSDGDSDFSALVVDEGGIELMFDAANFFRHHQFTLKWIIWSLFTICYDNFGNKAHLIRLGGIPKCCESMKATMISAEAQRHGMALLFDILRNTGEQEHRRMYCIRSLAINAGIHEVLIQSIESHGKEFPEVAHMGREILLGSNYKGDIPQYNGPDPRKLLSSTDK